MPLKNKAAIGQVSKAWIWPKKSAAPKPTVGMKARGTINTGYGTQSTPEFHVVAVDFGCKRNILRCLAETGFKVTVVPGNSSADDILKHNPDGVFLTNGPGDPAATGEYAVPMIKELIEKRHTRFWYLFGASTPRPRPWRQQPQRWNWVIAAQTILLKT